MKINGLILATLTSVYFLYCGVTPTEWHFIDNANLIFHEAGHSIFIFFGDFIHILGGSLFQILLPLVITLYFFFNKQKLSGAVCLMWVGQNFINVSVYAGDALKQNLPLLGGDSVIHDWNYLLTYTNELTSTDQIASILYNTGLVLIVLGAVVAFYAVFTAEDQKLLR